MQHLIKKQILELNLADDKDIFVIQQKTRDYFYHIILPELEKTLDGLSVSGQVIKIDRVEIDLGVITWEAWNQEITVVDVSFKIQNEIKKTMEFLKDKGNLNTLFLEMPETIPVSGYAFEQWLFYMQNGILPWNVTAVNKEWYAHVLEAIATDYKIVSKISELIGNNENALKRIVKDHPVSFLVNLITILTAEAHTSFGQQMKELAHFIFPHQTHSLQDLQNVPDQRSGILWEQVLHGVSGGISPEETIKNILKDHFQQRPSKHYQNSNIDFPLLDPLIKDISGMKSQKEGLADADQNSKFTSFENQSECTENIQKSVLMENGELKEQINVQLHEDGIYAENAGLVLLHPFYKSLFSYLNLTDGARFSDKNSHEKAVCLLYYLATGKTQTAEYQLTVPKILCSFPLGQSLHAGLELSSEEKSEATNLISAAIDQWSILKNTSAEGLKEGFLQRKGKVFYKNEKICFALEQNAIDVLLDYLPWNLSLFKLPWVDKLVTVDWR